VRLDPPRTLDEIDDLLGDEVGADHHVEMAL
jgi:hypothetical protein